MKEATDVADPDDPKLAMIDFGMTAHLTESMRNAVIRLLLSMAENRGDAAAEVLIEIGEYGQSFDRVAYTRDVASLVAKHADESVGDTPAGLNHDYTVSGAETLTMVVISGRQAEFAALPGFVDGLATAFSGSDGALLTAGLAFHDSILADLAAHTYQNELASTEGYGFGEGQRNEIAFESVCDTGPNPALDGLVESICIWHTGRVVFLDLDEVEWIEAADYYVQLHAQGKSYLHRETMASLEARLDPRRFVRIHRSAIVNQRFVRELRPKGQRDLLCVLASGAALKVARSHRDKLR
jgi:hypothetical protein